ncbi:hypothetical protein SprV_0702328200 [Sparganum proliferum]
MCQESSQCFGDFITNLTLAIGDRRYKEIKANNFERAMLVQKLSAGLRDEKPRENLSSEKRDFVVGEEPKTKSPSCISIFLRETCKRHRNIVQGNISSGCGAVN